MSFPLGEKTTEVMGPVCFPAMLRIGSPVLASQTQTVLSHDPEMILFPSGENDTVLTQPLCPLRTTGLIPPVFTMSQTQTLISHEPDTRWSPWGKNTIELMAFVCSFGSSRNVDSVMFQIRMVLSHEPDANSPPSHENTMKAIDPV